ncbi:hypothetical protein F5Y09DRAFT_338993 [Xylaria sp. FL1042]|nr:hypothetical protein F5Y09DRAFT_338993 [Xylaria sp. FL1042]
MTANKPKKGDKVSWSWGGGASGGTVAETRDQGEIAIKSKRGNTVKKNASPDNPAVHVERSGNDVVKRASELTVEKKVSQNQSKKDDDGENSGNKRKAKSQGGSETDTNEEEEETEETSDADDVHTTNKQGKEDGELKDETGGLNASENESEEETSNIEEEEMEEDEQKDEDEGGDEDDGGEENQKQVGSNKKSTGSRKCRTVGNRGEEKEEGESSGQAKPQGNKNRAGREDGDQVSTRTRSHDTAA